MRWVLILKASKDSPFHDVRVVRRGCGIQEYWDHGWRVIGRYTFRPSKTRIQAAIALYNYYHSAPPLLGDR